MKSKVLFFAALLCILVFIGCQDEPSFSKEGESIMALKAKAAFNNQNHTLKIATYNLHLYLGPAPFEDAVRQKQIETFIKSSLAHIDVLFLTEVWNDWTKNSMLNNLKELFPFSIHSNACNLNQGDGLLVLSKFPISDNEFTVFGNGAGWDWFASKGFHKTRFTTPFGDFVSFFTHTQSDETYSATRKKQLQQMRNHMSDLEVPSIIVGDLNIIGESDEYYDILKSVFPDYQDSYRKSNPNNPGYTYNSATNHLAHYYCSSNDYQQRLDYILFSSGWTAHSSKVIEHCRYYSESLKANASCSDHYGLESQLILIKNTVFPFRSNLAKSYQEALKKIDHLKARYGTGLTAKILIHNKTDKTLTFKSKATWYNSTFFNSPPNIPPGEYGLILASHDTGEATGVYNQLTYLYNNQKISFGTYVPWSWVYTNNVLVDFKEIDYNNLYYNSTRPWIYRKSAGLGITGSISTGDSPYVRFTVEKK
jgi:hypothetical protein